MGESGPTLQCAHDPETPEDYCPWHIRFFDLKACYILWDKTRDRGRYIVSNINIQTTISGILMATLFDSFRRQTCKSIVRFTQQAY